MSRRPRRHRPPLLDDPAPAPVPGARRPGRPGPGRPVSSWSRPGWPGRTSTCRGRASSSTRGPCCGASPERRSGWSNPARSRSTTCGPHVAATHGYAFDTPRADDRSRLHDRRGRTRDHALCSRSRRRVDASRSRPAVPRRCRATTSNSRAPRNSAGADVVALEQYGPVPRERARRPSLPMVRRRRGADRRRRRCSPTTDSRAPRSGSSPSAASTSRWPTGASPRRCSPPASRPSRSPTSTPSRSSVAASAAGRSTSSPWTRRALRGLRPS